MVSKLSPLLEDGHVERQFSIVSGGTGLTRTFRGGVFVRGSVVTTFSDTPITVADNDTSFVYIDTNSLTVVSSTTAPVEDAVMIAEIVAVSGAITTITEWRTRSLGLVDTS